MKKTEHFVIKLKNTHHKLPKVPAELHFRFLTGKSSCTIVFLAHSLACLLHSNLKEIEEVFL